MFKTKPNPGTIDEMDVAVIKDRINDPRVSLQKTQERLGWDEIRKLALRAMAKQEAARRRFAEEEARKPPYYNDGT